MSDVMAFTFMLIDILRVLINLSNFATIKWGEYAKHSYVMFVLNVSF